ncbi:chemosensory pili system protein ChpA (sensor histidine kinase/response regulator) [Paucibacter oligotrophus]|uniref:Chemotaxis protein CheA n=1 Tax=Roseateles oligotrophus TaxID=1769250 RepID=A0A840LFD6_9BURK|nr:Hpt domain-containing protein [Roseateles oligotrophus]MBB4845715.1 chemosensory pili system protein ChpA (sensor histidine kinase/response regulator) [Roseateles oligotrophus]
MSSNPRQSRTASGGRDVPEFRDSQLPRDAQDSELPVDLSPLAWVQEELRRSLETVHKSLRRHLRDGETRLSSFAALAGGTAEGSAHSPLLAAAAQLHQVAGVLSLVGLPAGATVLRAAEQAVSNLAQHPAHIDLPKVEIIERADFALLSLISRMLAGTPASALSLFPSFRELQALNGVERIHPADLWTFDWRWRELPEDVSAQAQAPAALRGPFEAALLRQMRESNKAMARAYAAKLSDLCAALAAALVGAPRSRMLWQLAAAQFEAQAQGLLVADPFVKRLGSRLLAQLRAVDKGDAAVNERLAHDLLFFCAQSALPGPKESAPRLLVVRANFNLPDQPPGDYEDESLGRIDPAWVSQGRRRVGAAKESWGTVAEGETHRLAGLDEQFASLADSLQRLFPGGAVLGEMLQRAVVSTLRSGKPPPAPLAMEVATSLLYVEAALDDQAFDQPEQAQRVKRLAGRIESVARGATPEPLEAWMEDLYRRVSDRQTLGSVVHELRASLAEVERLADEYFRDPSQRERLIPVPGQLSAMRGVLTVLGLSHAAQACVRMRDEVDRLASTEVDVARAAPRELFDRLANNLGALGFLIDMLGVQPALAKRMFVFDEATGRLSPLMGRNHAEAAADMAAPVPAPAAASSPAPASAPVLPPMPARPVQVAQPPASFDPEMREIFMEEAREVLLTAREALAKLRSEGQSREQLTVLRRAFHTLKGSSRMVGLEDFGEGAWACEQLYNVRLSDALPPSGNEHLLDFSAEALDYLGQWCEQIAAPQPGLSEPLHYSGPLRHGADALRLQGLRVPLLEEPAEPAAPAMPDLGLTEPSIFEPAAAVPPEPAVAAPEHAGFQSTELGSPLEFALTQQLEFPVTHHIDLPPTEVVERLLLDLPPEATPVPDEPVQPPAPTDAEVQAEFLALLEPEQAQAIAAVLHPAEAPEQATAAFAPAPGLDEDEPPFVLQLPDEASAVASAPPAEFELPEFELRLDLGEELPPVPAEPPTPERSYLSDADLPTLTESASLDEALARSQGDAPPVWEETQVPTGIDAGAPVDEASVPEALAEAAASAAGEPLNDAALLSSLDGLLDVVPAEPAVAEPADLLEALAAPEQAPLEAQAEAEADAVPLPSPAPVLELVRNTPPPELLQEQEQRAAESEEESVKVIGPIRVSITLFNIFLNEADELSRRLGTSLAEWALELAGTVPANCEPLAHALAGNAAAVQFEDLSTLARALEHALGRAQRTRHYSEAEAQMFVQAADEIRQLLHQFAAGFLRPHDPATLALLQAYQPEADPELELDSRRLDLDEELPQSAPFAASAAPIPAALDDEVEPGLPDAIDAELFPIFEDEAQELLGELHAALRSWVSQAHERSAGAACMRALHTFKGGARLSGAMRLGEQAHELETAVERALAQADGHEMPALEELLALQAGADALAASLETLRAAQHAPSVAPAAPAVPQPAEHLVAAEASAPASDEAQAAPSAGIDWSRFVETDPEAGFGSEFAASGLQAMVRVRGSLLERMAAQAGEVSIRRTRLESELAQMKGALLDLDDNLDRVRAQLRELELQAEAQMGSQQEQLQRAAEHFDPLEFDRYTRFQELTRMLAESVGDVATLQRSLQRNVQLGEDELAAQSRLTRELQDDLLRTRMVEFDSLSERMHRVVRQAARDTGKQAELSIVGGQTELDRSVLERMGGAFEHLLRNSVGHGIETPDVRLAAGKPAQGQLRLSLQQEGNEVLLNFSDDGAGLDLPRIRERAIELALMPAEAVQALSDAELMQLIFRPGFSTATEVTETSGRGVGMDVVRAEVATLGGTIETASSTGQGSNFTLRLPLTTALTQVVLLRCGEQSVAVPASLMDSVQRLPNDQLEQAYATGTLSQAGQELPFYWLGGLLGQPGRGVAHGKTASIVFMRNSQQRLALHVDEVLGNQEVVVKHLGSQLSRVPGLAGISLLASGDVALIYNPHALASWYGLAAQQGLRDLHVQAQQALAGEQLGAAAAAAEDEPQLAPLILVVDDSLTVRRVTQRLLEREGYRVQLAKDGLDAMERLAEEELPALVLSDIEMPRMDGFDLVRNMRGDARLAGLPVIMITSRIAQKHRDYAQELGVDHYLGKPYDEDQLLKLIDGYTSTHIPDGGSGA